MTRTRAGIAVPSVDAGLVVLVEGESDRAAVEAAASLCRVDLRTLDAVVLSMDGVTYIRHHLRRHGPAGDRRQILGLCDSAESSVVGRALAENCDGSAENTHRLRAGDPILLAHHGFQMCRRDLEDELIRAIGTRGVIDVIEATGERRAWHSMQQQPAQRDRPVADQLRRWLGSGATRKIRYAPLLIAALPPERLPEPLSALLTAIATAGLGGQGSAISDASAHRMRASGCMEP
ncbi:ATP-dependent endonuclease [Nakamurella sp. A5-74]|uniref:ATP-dependent endonuclease n=1 Tax=Nakamurella sp. A5-74 TaxID=3158264 RepID=A0AAU8DU72_9ACTN